VDIDHPVTPRLDKAGIEEAHEAGERDEFDAILPQRTIGRGGESGAVPFGDDLMRDPGVRTPAVNAEAP
jgi:hypothetical protein